MSKKSFQWTSLTIEGQCLAYSDGPEPSPRTIYYSPSALLLNFYFSSFISSTWQTLNKNPQRRHSATRNTFALLSPIDTLIPHMRGMGSAEAFINHYQSIDINSHPQQQKQSLRPFLFLSVCPCTGWSVVHVSCGRPMNHNRVANWHGTRVWTTAPADDDNATLSCSCKADKLFADWPLHTAPVHNCRPFHSSSMLRLSIEMIW